MSQWIGGFISGVIATLIGFALTLIWDIYKSRRDKEQKDGAILRAMKHEFEENLEISKYNKSLLEEELKIIDQKKEIVPPLLLLKSGFWDLLKINLPAILLKQENVLKKIRDISLLASHINGGISSRQNYKNSSSMMSNYSSTIKIYDGIIVREIDALDEEATTAIAMLPNA